MSRYIDEHRGRFGVEPICRVLHESLGDIPPAEFELRARSTDQAEYTTMQELS